MNSLSIGKRKNKMWISLGKNTNIKFRNPFKIDRSDCSPNAGCNYLCLIKNNGHTISFFTLYGAFGGWVRIGKNRR